MKNKKIFLLVLICLMSFGLFACSSNKANAPKEGNKVEAKEDKNNKKDEKDEKDEKDSDFKMPRVAALKGPTAMGMSKMFEEDQSNLTILTAPDQVVAGLSKGEFDVAAIPSNMASILYNKTEGKLLKVAAINTLGNLYIASSDASIKFIPDLKGKKIVSAGQGASPEYVLNYLLEKNGLAPDDVTIEWKSEHQEVLASSGEDNTVLLLPQPFMTIALSKDKTLVENIDLNKEYKKATQGRPMVMGVLVVSKAYLENSKKDFEEFLDKYEDSIKFVNENPKEAAAIIEKLGIAPAALAEKAIPKANMSYEDGMDMKRDLEGFLSVLEKANPKSIGGKMPGEDFYFVED
ncbi:ABC transporter substrate-binding protein [Peptoniphilus sp. GNH]|nr:ABC transporter substrate-binding protein [Peptoniphilus sp. GNH]